MSGRLQLWLHMIIITVANIFPSPPRGQDLVEFGEGRDPTWSTILAGAGFTISPAPIKSRTQLLTHQEVWPSVLEPVCLFFYRIPLYCTAREHEVRGYTNDL